LEDGCIDQEARAATTAWVREDLSRRYEGSPAASLVAPFFQSTVIKGYGTLQPTAAPLWKNARGLMEQLGFSVDEEFIGDRPQEGVCCVFTARRKE
jgi:hypothetical protein